MKFVRASTLVCLVAACFAVPADFGAREGKLKPTQLLRSYKGFVNDFYRKNDAYRLEYNVGDSARFEERTDSGEVSGTYAFVAPEGDEYEFKYQANDEGFKVEGDALPEAPEETDDVKAARAAFFDAYEKQLELAGSGEDSEEDDDEESSEESDENDDDNEESSEEDDDDDDEEEEVKQVPEVNVRGGSRGFGRRRVESPVSRPVVRTVPSFFRAPSQYRRQS
ncbi:nucleolin [Hyalella azteca]|uniref:Nucleolin n=1 Tax=Hyalella azteca TaxID=294128 RepID=A0A8B7NM28_HYAAZ|nr:nucleolin [Hyalella azteca]